MDIFEYALNKSGCWVISDMPYLLKYEDLIRIFRNTPIELFTVEEWNDLLEYILKNRYQRKKSMEDIYRFLKKSKKI